MTAPRSKCVPSPPALGSRRVALGGSWSARSGPRRVVAGEAEVRKYARRSTPPDEGRHDSAVWDEQHRSPRGAFAARERAEAVVIAGAVSTR